MPQVMMMTYTGMMTIEEFINDANANYSLIN